MTCSTDTLARVWARSNQEVVRHGIEDWTVSTCAANGHDAGCSEGSYTRVLCSIDNIRACNVLPEHAAVPSARTTSRPDMAWDYSDATDEQLSERTLSLQVQVQSELVYHIDVSNVGERCCLERACSVKVGEAVLYVPRCDRTSVLPMVGTVQRKTKIR